MPPEEQSAMAIGRALLTEGEQGYLRGEASDQRKYEARSRVRSRITGPLSEDVELLQEYHPDLLTELQEVVLSPTAPVGYDLFGLEYDTIRIRADHLEKPVEIAIQHASIRDDRYFADGQAVDQPSVRYRLKSDAKESPVTVDRLHPPDGRQEPLGEVYHLEVVESGEPDLA